ncbi:MAG: hypothetical protein FWC53_00960 [Firmicutes bacterium]|nr:hypothetical protein [Bacillota bacterium]
MRINLEQTKLIVLTGELALKAEEYKKLCNKLDNLKAKNIDENDERLFVLKDLFELNNKQIVDINRQLKELKNSKTAKTVIEDEQYSSDDIFKREKESKKINPAEANITVVYSKKNILKKIWDKIKRALNR